MNKSQTKLIIKKLHKKFYIHHGIFIDKDIIYVRIHKRRRNSQISMDLGIKKKTCNYIIHKHVRLNDIEYNGLFYYNINYILNFYISYLEGKN